MNDHANVRAFIGQTELPQSLVEQTAASKGRSTEYQTMWYLRLLAIFPWFAIVSALIAAFVAWRATSAVNAVPPPVASEKPARSVDNSSKESVHAIRNEKVESILALVTFAAVSSALVVDPNPLVCETTPGSPNIFDAYLTAEEMPKSPSSHACRDRGADGKCTQIWTYKTAAANICGTWMGCITWQGAADAVRRITDSCRDDGLGKAGGKFHVNADVRIDLFHT
ncbi:hypothetical protein NMY22_g4224 [Coprinellus aureogranulatus]|nr:hypothetical protein NMY22_g4224 [Coprinellus aureogranulatus]